MLEKAKPYLGPVLATLALYAGCMVLYVFKHGGDACTLCCVGKSRLGQPPYEDVRIGIGPSGYDGQFYYVIARAPWSRHSYQSIDAPAARQLRILYPALCWLLSGGHSRLLFYIMPAVNLLALAALAGAGAWMALRHGFSPWWGAMLPWAVNAGLPALHNLTDPLAMLALFVLLSAWLTQGPAWVLALSAAAALFSREQNLLLLGVVFVASLRSRRLGVSAGLAAVVLLWAAWVVALRLGYGAWPFLQGQGNFGWPLAGMLFRWTHLGGNQHFSTRLAIIFTLSMLHLTFLIGLGLYLARQRVHSLVRVSILAGIGLATVGNTLMFGDFWSYTRVFFWLPLGIWLAALQLRQRWALTALAPALLWTLAGALRYV